jgi:glyoxalase-like protein
MTHALAVDHLVYATPDLSRGIEQIEKLLGVQPAIGGRHVGRGTHNALVALGEATYLEIIAPDPEQPDPPTPRAFGLDDLEEARLVTWAAKSNDVERVRAEAEMGGVLLGGIQEGSRRRPDGVTLSWRYTNPATVVADGLIPFFIDWGKSPNPAVTAPQGARLVALRAEHPDATSVLRQLQLLGIELPVSAGRRRALIAMIDSPRGRVELR